MLASMGALSGCASQPLEFTASIAQPAAASVAAGGGYALSANDMELNCKELTGRMQLRILEIRDYAARRQTSAAARALQSGASSIFGGTAAGADPASAYAADRAKLEAFNQRLASLNCKTYNLQDELQPKDILLTPLPVEPATTQKR